MDQLHQMDMINQRYNRLHPTAVQKTACHAEIYIRFFIRKDSVTEIAEDLHMPQSTVSRSVTRIVNIIKQYRGE